MRVSKTLVGLDGNPLVIPQPEQKKYLKEFFAYQRIPEQQFRQEYQGEFIVEDVQRSTDERGVETEHVKLRGTEPVT